MSSVNTSVAPYHDDYDPNKNFHKILFTPRRAVQVRELNQIQSILQAQIQRFGDHVFENGSMVIPGELNYNMQFDYVKVTGFDYAAISPLLNAGEVTLEDVASQTSAKLVMHSAPTVTDPATFFVQYISASNSSPGFIASASINIKSATGAVVATATAIGTGKGSVFDIAAGIFYINGSFIRTDSQRIILSKYTSTPSVIVGFRLTETVITTTDDPSLYDNASGTTNFNAIGADRLKKMLTLEVHPTGSAYNKEDFIELAVFSNGVLQKKARGVEYSVLEETLAKRTYDESGDYTVSAFGVRVREHLDNGTNDGMYPAPDGKENKFVVGIEPGKAYVKGFPVETVSTVYLENNKARTSGTENNISSVAAVESFIIARFPNKMLMTNNHPLVYFYNMPFSEADNAPGNAQMLGTARARYVRRYDNGGGDIGMFIYFYDYQNFFVGTNYPGSSFVTFSEFMVCPEQDWTAEIVANERYIQNPQRHAALFKLPVKDAKSISDLSFSVRRSFTVTTDGSGVAVLTVGSNEVFMQPTLNDAFAEIDGTTYEIFGISALGGAPTGKTLTISFGATKANKTVNITVDVLKQSPIRKTKTKTPFSVTVAPPTNANARRRKIGVSDLIEVTSIKENGVERKHAYTVITNTTAEYYGVAEVRLNDLEPVPSAATITIEGFYYAHSAGDYIAAESYVDGYETIPQFTLNNTQVNLADYIDFRPKAPNTGVDFAGTGGSITEMVSPFGRITFDNEYYMPRIDIVYVTSRGEFGIVNGIPSLDPKTPSAPDNAMAIYKLIVPAFTNSVKDIQIEYINNRRYTMRDIGKLEDRISKLEYYTSLNLLEVETQSLQITNGAGLNRFKNGFVVDNFVDHSVGFFTSPNYKCSISSKENTLRPEFNAEFVDFDFSSASTNVVRTGSLITLPYTQKTFVSQLLASGTMNVNPYAVYNWIGNMTLMPATDTWFDTRYTAPDVTYQIFNNGRLTQQWNSWTLNWTGGTERDVTDLWNQTIRTTTTTNIAVVGEKEVDRTVVPYMRSKAVNFTAKGLLPKSRVYPFFDNVNVSAHCKPAGGVFGDPIITNADGDVSGEFVIPNEASIKFRTGTKQFTLIDNQNNDRVQSISTADADYTAAGVLLTKTQSIVATQQINTVTTRVTARDPLAQSFLVDKKGGVFLTSVDLFFASKDATVPVTLEIRTMDNGYPGQHILPYSTTTLKPSEVSTSTDGSVPTTFTFKSPVHLSDGQEYCFVVLSNCNTYNVYIATMGEKQIGTNTYISKQPFVGVMFKSQNNTTWTAEQMSDMKFVVRIAEFNTNVVGKAVFENSTIPKVKLGPNPIISNIGSNSVFVNIPSHGLVVGSKFALVGVAEGNGFALSQLNITHTVASVVSSDLVTCIISSNATASGSFGGENASADRNVQICTLHGMSQQLMFENTNLSWKYSGVTGRSVSGSETAYGVTNEFDIPINNNIDLTAPLMICSQTDTSSRAFTKSGKMIATLQTYSSNISPVIDLERVGVVAVSNKINTTTANKEQTDSGDAEARYITKVISLATPAKFLRVYMDVLLPSDAEVLLYCRTGNSESDVLGSSWTQITPTASMFTAPTYVEHTFEKQLATNFTSYQFKVVMLSRSSCNIPKVKRFRGIALAT